MTSPFVIAIDGPVAAGKTTVGRMLASRIDALFFDTGVLYRTVAHQVLALGINADDRRAVANLTASMDVDLQDEGGETRLVVNGCDISEELRTPEIDRTLPSVSANPGVRQALLGLQREIVRGRRAVVVGRDIGTVVLPDADLKIYLDAARDVRATRRYEEMLERGVEIDWDTVYRDLLARDERDSSRKHAPLTKADDAVAIDASSRDAPEVVDVIAELVGDRGGLCLS